MNDTAPAITHHAALDARMAKAARGIRLLSLVSWPASEQQTFLADYARGQAKLPAHQYPKHDFSDARREFEAIIAAADPAHPLGGLVEILADRIREYEGRVHPWPDTSTPASVLASLMDEHGLRQSDLPEIGSQGVVSEVLAGKRQLNLRQVRALAARFSVPMEMLAG